MEKEGVKISNDGYGTPGKATQPAGDSFFGGFSWQNLVLGTSEVYVIFTKIQ